MPHRLLVFFDRRMLAILGVVLLAITMRSGVAAVSTLIELIRQDFDLSTTFLAVLAAIPPACCAVAGIFSTVLSNHVPRSRRGRILRVRPTRPKSRDVIFPAARRH